MSDWIITNEEDELYHWGILGMKWGVRRYQNRDGTWTQAGLRRRGLSPDAQKRADRKKEIKNIKSKQELDKAKSEYKKTKAENRKAIQEAKAAKAKAKQETKIAKAQAHRDEQESKRAFAKRMGKDKSPSKRVNDAIKSGNADQIQKEAKNMTTEELREALTRAQLNANLAQVSSQQKQKGIYAYKKVADVVNTTANLTSNGITIYNNVARVMNSVAGKNLPTIAQPGSEKSATQRAMDAARLRTAQAQATQMEINARRAAHEEALADQQRAVSGFSDFRARRAATAAARDAILHPQSSGYNTTVSSVSSSNLSGAEDLVSGLDLDSVSFGDIDTNWRR